MPFPLARLVLTNLPPEVSDNFSLLFIRFFFGCFPPRAYGGTPKCERVPLSNDFHHVGSDGLTIFLSELFIPLLSFTSRHALSVEKISFSNLPPLTSAAFHGQISASFPFFFLVPEFFFLPHFPFCRSSRNPPLRCVIGLLYWVRYWCV